MTVPEQTLRELVREAVSAALSSLPAPVPPAAPAPPPQQQPVADPTVEEVRLVDDGDLHHFVLRLLARAESPHFRRQLQTGALRFRLAGGGAAGTPRSPETVVAKGAVTERLIRAAAKSGHHVRVGPAAVLTPLARDAARMLGVTVVVEQRKGA